MIRSRVSPYSARRSAGRGSSSSRYSDKSDNTLLTPLIEDSSSYTSDSEDESTTSAASSYEGVPDEKPSFSQLAKLAVVNVVLVGGVAASVASFLPGVLLLSPSIMVYAAGALTIVNAPYAAFKEVRITKLPSLRLLNNKLAEEATRLEKEVDALSEEIDAIAPEAERAGAVEEELREIADRQQFNVDRLIDLVNENEEVLDQMRDNLRQKIVQDIVRIVIKSDANNDQTFCKVESKMLALKIRLQLQEYGVEFDEMKFYKVLNVDPSLPRVLKIVQKLIQKYGEDDESESDEDDINEDLEDDMYDMFRLASEKSMRMTGSIHDVPEDRRASSALMRSSSWRSATGDLGDSTSSDTIGARQCTLALMQLPSARREKRKSKGRRGSLVSL